jgi:hypothetical protein
MNAAKPPIESCKESFGLTDKEYQFLLDDIDQAIEEGNKLYGYGNDGNYYPLPDSSLKRPGRIRKRRPKRLSVEEVAIASGLIKIHRMSVDSKREADH